MTPELDKKLCEEFPNIFINRRTRESCMYYGFPGDGWYDLIRDICLEFERVQKEIGMQYVALQVKEKMGGLRFYFTEDGRFLKIPTNERGNIYNKTSNFVNSVEDKSFSICENCGSNDAKLQGTGWKHTLCDDCYTKKQNGTLWVR